MNIRLPSKYHFKLFNERAFLYKKLSMKKFFLNLLLLSMCSALFVACSDDDNDGDVTAVKPWGIDRELTV